MSSTTSLAAQAAASPLFAAFVEAHAAPENPETALAEAPAPPAFPRPWQGVLALAGAPFARYGTVTFMCPDYFLVLFDGEKSETQLTADDHDNWTVSKPHWWLPMWFFTQNLGAHCTDEKGKLLAINYDLVLHSGEYVSECFFKVNRFLEIAGPRRQIALADVARLRPSK